LIGYVAGAQLVKESLSLGVSIAELAEAKAAAGKLSHRDANRLVSAEEIKAALIDLRKLTEGGIIG